MQERVTMTVGTAGLLACGAAETMMHDDSCWSTDAAHAVARMVPKLLTNDLENLAGVCSNPTSRTGATCTKRRSQRWTGGPQMSPDVRAYDSATRAHDAAVRAKAAAWAMRKACKADNPEAWRDLCEAIAEALDASGKAMDLTRPPWVEEMDEEDARERLREVQYSTY